MYSQWNQKIQSNQQMYVLQRQIHSANQDIRRLQDLNGRRKSHLGAAASSATSSNPSRQAIRRHRRNIRRNTRMCWNVLYGIECPHGDKCAYAHNKEEMRPTVQQQEE